MRAAAGVWQRARFVCRAHHGRACWVLTAPPGEGVEEVVTHFTVPMDGYPGVQTPLRVKAAWLERHARFAAKVVLVPWTFGALEKIEEVAA